MLDWGDMTSNLITYFDNYVSIGFQPIVLSPRSKKPVMRRWNCNYDAKKWRQHLEIKPDKPFNLGILLGRFVDVESDNEEGNRLLSGLIGSTRHPCFRSDRSVHHIFLNPDVNLTVAKFHGIEFRGNMVHSVFPPSTHQSGSQYRFLKDSVLQVPPMPKALLDLYWENRKPQRRIGKRRPDLKDGYKRIACAACGKATVIHNKRLTLEIAAFGRLGARWSCHSCRDFDVRESCRDIRRQYRSR